MIKDGRRWDIYIIFSLLLASMHYSLGENMNDENGNLGIFEIMKSIFDKLVTFFIIINWLNRISSCGISIIFSDG